MRLLNIFIFAFSCVSCVALAQGEMAVSGLQARRVLDAMAARAKVCATIDMDFSATYENKRSGDKKSFAGTLKVKGEAYVLDAGDVVTYYDSEKVSVWQKKIGELTISGHDEEAEGDMTPAKLFGAYDKGYKLRLLGEAEIGGVVCHEVDLYPTDSKSPIMRIRLFVDKKTNLPRRFVQQLKLGEALVVDILRLTPDKPLPDSVFAFDTVANADVEVVDLR